MPEARPLPDPLRGAGRGVRPVHVAAHRQRSAPADADDFVWPPAEDTAAFHMVSVDPPRKTSGASAPAKRERRRKRSDRRKRERRVVDHGSPYGTERRSGIDDRQGDRRAGAAGAKAGVGLSRDYFSQAEARVTAFDTGLPDGALVRFHD